MADKKISQLTSSTTPLAGSEVLPIVQGGSTVKVAVSNLTAGRTVAADFLNVGGFALAPWGASEKVTQVGSVYSFGLRGLMRNAYHDGSSFRYISTDAASRYHHTGGVHQFFSAASGTAGDAITFTQTLTLTATGDLGIGTASPSQRVHNVGNYRQNDATNSYGFELQNGTGTSRLVTISGGSAFAIQTGGNAVDYLNLDGNGNVTAGAGTLATTATNGFLYVPTCAGTPTGTPTAKSGYAPIVVNTTNNKLYFYSGGVWRDAGP